MPVFVTVRRLEVSDVLVGRLYTYLVSRLVSPDHEIEDTWVKFTAEPYQ